MVHKNIKYKEHIIQIRTDVKSHTACIFFDGNIIKCVAGDIFPDGSTNVIKKAKYKIDESINSL